MSKCSMIDHKEIDALSFCKECKIYMCNKCEKYHSELFKNHQQYKVDKDNTEIFTGLCNEKNHLIELKYFCKVHNILCCAECITKLKGEYNGQHSDCEVCFIKDIENEKKNKLKENIKSLEDLSNTFQQSINDLKTVYEKINKNKEEIKANIQNIFTQLRNELNNREDKLLLEVDQKFDELFVKEDIIKQTEKLPNKIKTSLEKGKLIDKQWNDNNNKLNSLIHYCLNIEENIQNINNINENLEKFRTMDLSLRFYPEDKGVKEFIQNIQIFGEIEKNSKNKFDSKIEFDQELVKSWLNNRGFISELLFRKTRDGSTPKDFHNKCDNKGITIIFIETTKGYKFGGYTELQWDTSSSGKKDKSTFIFSFNNKQKYTARNNNDSITCNSHEGPRFGCGWPEIYFNKTLNRGESYSHNINTFVTDYKLTNGESNWEVKELEVFKIKYI